MAYCAVTDVQSLIKARVLGQGKNPTSGDVTGYIAWIAAELDAILIEKGYAVPLDPAYTDAYTYLTRLNALGAAMMTEEASPQSVNLDRLRADYMAAKEKLEKARTVMNVPQDMQRAGPRGPGLTMFPTGHIFDPYEPRHHGPGGCNNPANPYFSRETRY